MWILDRQRYLNFFKAYVVCFITLIGLYIVIDVFANIDEFAKRAKGLAMLRLMGRFYLVHSTLIYDRLFGVITMMAAIFTVTWMQRSNELIAMLAAGIGTRRVIRPVLVSAILVNGLAIANQEWLMPQFGEELLKEANEDETKSLPVSSRYDTRDILIHGRDGDQARKPSGTSPRTWPRRFSAHKGSLKRSKRPISRSGIPPRRSKEAGCFGERRSAFPRMPTSRISSSNWSRPRSPGFRCRSVLRRKSTRWRAKGSISSARTSRSTPSPAAVLNGIASLPRSNSSNRSAIPPTSRNSPISPSSSTAGSYDRS